MAERISRPPLWLLPKPKSDLPAVVEGNPIAAYAFALAALGALVPAFLLLAPDSRWTPQDLFVILLVFGFVSRGATVRLRGDTTFNSAFIALLLAVVFLGPLPGALIGAVTQIPSFLEVRRALWFLSNVASHTWASLVGAWTLQALSVSTPFGGGNVADYFAIAVAGVALICVNYLLGKIIVEFLDEGLGLWARVRQELIATAPATGGLIAAGVLTAFLYAELGIVGLAPLVGILLLPRIVTPRVLRGRALSDLERPQATAVLAETIADVLHLDRRQKRIVRDAATHLGDSASLSRLDDFPDVMQAVLYWRERWDQRAGGFPGVVGGEDIPLESRVLAVAEAWSAQTARGTRQLPPAQAVAGLEVHAGREFDPRVVAAAIKAVKEDLLPAPRAREEERREEPLRDLALRA